MPGMIFISVLGCLFLFAFLLKHLIDKLAKETAYFFDPLKVQTSVTDKNDLLR
jgi:hypothetical protein